VDIRRLEIFCRVVELKSFTRAADAVLLSQPTVSEHVRLLEDALGEKLLDRLGRQVLPTPAGLILYRYARRIIQLRDEAVQAMADYRGKPAGRLIIGASTIPGAYILPPLIERFKQLHPAIQLTLKIAGSGAISHELVSGNVELAIIGTSSKEQELECRDIFTDDLVLAVPSGHPLAARGAIELDELDQYPFLLREEGSGTRSVMNDILRYHGFDPARLKPVAEMGSTEAIRQGIKSRLGISILSILAIGEELQNGTLVQVPINGVLLTRPLYLVQRKNRQLSPLALSFLDFLMKHNHP
jgi:DNA-binding transcriptional LysR family regulator